MTCNYSGGFKMDMEVRIDVNANANAIPNIFFVIAEKRDFH